MKKNRYLPPLAWLGLPLFSLLIFWLTPLLGYRGWVFLMTGEHGYVEAGTFVLLLPVIFFSGVLIFRFLHLPELPRRSALIISAVMLLLGLSAFYFAGEEVNWGQIWFDWKTPRSLAAINYQQEINIHNIEGMSAFNNLPRLILLILTVAGGIILPLFFLRLRRRPGADREIRYYLIPSPRIIPAAMLAACISLPDKLLGQGKTENLFPGDFTYSYMAFLAHSGELKEYGFALLMLLYVLEIYLLVQPRRELE